MSLDRTIRFLALAALACGMGGMTMSFFYLAAADPRDVVAGAAGFIAGSVLVAAGLVSLSFEGRTSGLLHPNADVRLLRFAAESPVRVEHWLAHFERNREQRVEPDWTAPIALTAEVMRPLVRSLEQFQLGDGGGPAYLIARDRERFLAQFGHRQLVDHWFREEREHARLLGGAVARFGGRCIRSHWSFSVFCTTRRWLGVRFELTVLLLTEIASTVYYRLLRRHGNDVALRAMCRLILRDEAGHIAFHRDRLARDPSRRFGSLWEGGFRLLGLAAATMLWINHAPGLKAIGATRGEFYREVWLELSRFVGRLRRDRAGQERVT